VGVTLPRGFTQKSRVRQPACQAATGEASRLCGALGRAGAEAGHEAAGDARSTVAVSAEPVIGLAMKDSGPVNLVLL